jgi:hypothetical protein
VDRVALFARGRIGWDPNMLPRIAVVQLTSVVLYLIPQTAVLGVVLLTGYLGGAISQYTRLEIIKSKMS